MKLDHMKILYVIPRLNNEGPVNQLYSLINEFKKFTNLAIKIVTIYNEIDDSRINEFKKMKIDIESIAIEKKYDIAGMVKSMNKIISKENPDIIHSATLMADILIGICNTSVKWVSTIHCNIYKDYIWKFGKIRGHMVILAHEWAIKRMDKAICCSKSIAKEFGKFGEKVIDVQNGILIDDINKNTENSKLNLKQKLGLCNKRKIIVVVGSIDERKNTEYILKNIYDRIEDSEYQLILLGGGTLYTKLKNKYSNKYIVFKGKVGNVSEFLECADVYISASKSEGLPLSVIEAGLKGVPLILSDIPAHKELQNGKCNGIYFFDIKNDKFDFENLIDEVVDNKLEIQQYFQTYFSAYRMAKDYINVYKKIYKQEN